MAENKDKIQNELTNTMEAQQSNSTTGQDEPKFKLEVYDGVTIIPDLAINRESFLSKGKSLWKYQVVGRFREKTVIMDLDAGSFYLSGKRYTDTDIYDMLNFVFDSFSDVRFGVKSFLDGNRRNTQFFVVGKTSDGIYSLVPVSFGGRDSSLAKLSTLFSDISLRYGVTLPGLF